MNKLFRLYKFLMPNDFVKGFYVGAFFMLLLDIIKNTVRYFTGWW